MPASAVCCLDLKGRLLLARDYRGDVPLRQAERFMSKLGELEEGTPRPPVVLMDGEREEGGRARFFPFPSFSTSPLSRRLSPPPPKNSQASPSRTSSTPTSSCWP